MPAPSTRSESTGLTPFIICAAANDLAHLDSLIEKVCLNQDGSPNQRRALAAKRRVRGDTFMEIGVLLGVGRERANQMFRNAVRSVANKAEASQDESDLRSLALLRGNL